MERCTENCFRERFVIDSVFKANSWSKNLKYLNDEKIKRCFDEKELFLSKF